MMSDAFRSRWSFTCLAITALAGCRAPHRAHQGYAEGEFVLIASPFAGVLDSLQVQRGQQIAAGDPLFGLERGSEAAARQESEARLRSAHARLDDLRATRRMPELEASRAEALQAAAANELSRAQFERERQLFERGLVEQERLDEASTRQQRDSARLQQVQAQLRLAEQSIGRDREVAAALAETDAARAALAQAEWSWAQKARRAPHTGLVHETYFVQGEWVPAGRPVVSLLPPANIKLRFYVPEAEIGSVRVGQAARVTCDGCGEAIPATVSWVSTQSEFTPPLIYSRETRTKLVFMVEARPAAADAARLKPGQPVDVTW